MSLIARHTDTSLEAHQSPVFIGQCRHDWKCIRTSFFLVNTDRHVSGSASELLFLLVCQTLGSAPEPCFYWSVRHDGSASEPCFYWSVRHEGSASEPCFYWSVRHEGSASEPCFHWSVRHGEMHQNCLKCSRTLFLLVSQTCHQNLFLMVSTDMSLEVH